MAEVIEGEKFKPNRVFHIPTQTWHERQPVDCKEIVRDNPEEWSFEKKSGKPAPAVKADPAAEKTEKAPRRRGGRPKKHA